MRPFVDPVLMGRPGGCTPTRMCEEYEIPGPARAQFVHAMSKTGASRLVSLVTSAIALAATSAHQEAAEALEALAEEAAEEAVKLRSKR